MMTSYINSNAYNVPDIVKCIFKIDYKIIIRPGTITISFRQIMSKTWIS